MVHLRPIDMVRAAVKSGNDDRRSVANYVKNKHKVKLTNAVIGRLLSSIRREQERVAITLLTGSTEDGEIVDKAVCGEINALIKKHGLAKVQAAVEVAGWFVG